MKLHVSGKVSDRFSCYGEGIDYDGYVPACLGIGSGDYIEFTFDTVTGQILGLKVDDSEILEMLGKNDEDESEDE